MVTEPIVIMQRNSRILTRTGLTRSLRRLRRPIIATPPCSLSYELTFMLTPNV